MAAGEQAKGYCQVQKAFIEGEFPDQFDLVL
jgi:hypothetical protein